MNYIEQDPFIHSKLHELEIVTLSNLKNKIIDNSNKNDILNNKISLLSNEITQLKSVIQQQQQNAPLNNLPINNINNIENIMNEINQLNKNTSDINNELKSIIQSGGFNNYYKYKKYKNKYYMAKNK